LDEDGGRASRFEPGEPEPRDQSAPSDAQGSEAPPVAEYAGEPAPPLPPPDGSPATESESETENLRRWNPPQQTAVVSGPPKAGWWRRG
jgi:hypothetical protein